MNRIDVGHNLNNLQGAVVAFHIGQFNILAIALVR